jgi:hypothetical protein
MSEIRKRDRSDTGLLFKDMEEESVNTSGAAKAFHSLPEETRLLVVVSGVSGTDPTLDLTIEGSDDAETWSDLAILPTISTAGAHSFGLGAQDYAHYRYSSVIGGQDNPAFTYLIALSC